MLQGFLFWMINAFLLIYVSQGDKPIKLACMKIK